MFDQKPVGTLLAFSLAHPGQDPAALKLLTLQSEVKLAFSVCALGVVAVSEASIPHHDGATAILSPKLWTYSRRSNFKTP